MAMSESSHSLLSAEDIYPRALLAGELPGMLRVRE